MPHKSNFKSGRINNFYGRKNIWQKKVTNLKLTSPLQRPRGIKIVVRFVHTQQSCGGIRPGEIKSDSALIKNEELSDQA